MKRRVHFFFLFLPLLPAAQTSSEVEITAEPHHHLALENVYVRAFKVEVSPGQATLMHRHRHDYIYVVLEASEISNQVEGKPPVIMKMQAGQTEPLDGGFAHIARDLGSTAFRNVTIELLRDGQARKSPPPRWGVNGEDERGLRVLDGGTQDILFVKDGVRASEIELQPGGRIPRHHHAGPHLVVALTDLDLHDDVVGKAATAIRLSAGDIQWAPGNLNHTVTNMGTREAKLITLEFH
jgi:quercetin dioxygenase-like cupin family protein